MTTNTNTCVYTDDMTTTQPSIKLMFNDPRQPKPTHKVKELNCDRWALVDNRLFQVRKLSPLWDIQEIATQDSMIDTNEGIWGACLTLEDVRKTIAKHLLEFPQESKEAHCARVRERTNKYIASMMAGG